MAVASVATMAADAPADGSMCDAISLEELNAVGPLQFESPETTFGGTSLCNYSTPSGSTLALVQSGISFELMRSAASDLVEFQVADRPAVSADGFVHVGLDEGILSVALDLADPAELGGLDAIDYQRDVAAIVVAALESRTAAADPASASSLQAPPEVPGIEWGRSGDVTSIGELMEADAQQGAVFQPLLDAIGVDASQIFITDVTALSTDTDPAEGIGNYGAIQVLGADEAGIRSAIIDWLAAVSGPDGVSTEDRDLGGKAVVALTVGDELQGYLYVHGDTAYALTMPEEAAASVLEALP